jgi:hypothetical protein
VKEAVVLFAKNLSFEKPSKFMNSYIKRIFQMRINGRAYMPLLLFKII